MILARPHRRAVNHPLPFSSRYTQASHSIVGIYIRSPVNALSLFSPLDLSFVSRDGGKKKIGVATLCDPRLNYHGGANGCWEKSRPVSCLRKLASDRRGGERGRVERRGRGSPASAANRKYKLTVFRAIPFNIQITWSASAGVRPRPIHSNF